ncbi:MAG: GAF domain-containing protein [Spirochaetes bacterium]|nr:GAF domain-containing protein [Spirochaetota bacterium]
MHDEKKTLFDLLKYFGIIAKDLGKLTTVHRTLERIMQHIENIFGPENSSILIRRNNGDLKFICVRGAHSEKIRERVLAKGHGVAGWIAEHGESLVISDPYNDQRFNPDLDRITGYTTTSIIGVPLKTSKQIFGVIELMNRLDKKPFREIDLFILETIADLTAMALERLYYYYSTLSFYATDPISGVYTKQALLWQLRMEKNKCVDGENRRAIIAARITSDEKQIRQSELRTIGALLKKCSAPGCTIYRYNEATFIILFNHENGDAVNKLTDDISRRFRHGSLEKNLDISFDVLQDSICSKNVDDIIRSLNIRDDIARLESFQENLSENMSANLENMINAESPLQE